MDKLQLMATYVHVLKGGSFAAAADQLGVSRAVVTKHIAKLEHALGVRLLHRTTRRLRPTDIGLKYFEFCNKTLSEIEDAEADVIRLQKEPRGSLRIAVPKAFGSLHTGEAIAEFVARCPQIEVSTFISDVPLDPKSMFDNGFDLAIRLTRPKDSSIVARQVCKLGWVACASPEYIGRTGEIRSPAQLSNLNCLIHTAATAGGYWRFTGSKGKTKVKVSGNMISNSAMVLRGGAIAGTGVALLPVYCIESDLAEGRLCRVLPTYAGPQDALFLLFPYRSQVPQKVRLFIDYLVDRFRSSPWNVV